jgi:hypothetical protein
LTGDTREDTDDIPGIKNVTSDSEACKDFVEIGYAEKTISLVIDSSLPLM